ncbi:MAG: type II toxin-antitoxin system RelB/DinJ family antitoxin [Eubacteriaceae bacterium]|nr:type II toxin-antitoxin system RelB/DinJ family antitoxin [Eubacteriaceae bacterium]
MSDTTNLNLRLDKELKKQAEELFAGLGINMTTAINIFLRQAVREQGIPFQITAKSENKKETPPVKTVEAEARKEEKPVSPVVKPEIVYEVPVKKPVVNQYVISKLKEADLSAKIDQTRYTFEELTHVIRRRRAK